MSSSIAIPKRKNKQLERASVADSLGSSASSPSSSLDQRSNYGSFEPKSPQSPTNNRRPSLMSASFSKAEHTVVNVGDAEFPRLITCVKASQGFDWNQEMFLPSYADFHFDDLERRQDPVEDIVVTDEEVKNISRLDILSTTLAAASLDGRTRQPHNYRDSRGTSACDLPAQTTPKQSQRPEHTTHSTQTRPFFPLHYSRFWINSQTKHGALRNSPSTTRTRTQRTHSQHNNTNPITMQSEHRKIELQSPGDLTYLTSQIRSAALSKLDLHLPAQPSDSADDLRAQTSSLVDAFVASVLAGLRKNITINGLEVVTAPRGAGFGDADAMEGVQTATAMAAEMLGGVEGVEKEEFEPFDEKLRVRLADAVAKRDRLVGAISKHRRETPAAAARRFEEAFERERVQGEEAVRALVEKVEGQGREEEEEVLDVQVKREEEVRRNWERAVEGLGRLNKGLPETRARLERCGDVVGYLGGEKK
ncbi:hypothetical protein SVAN01_01959 [Stagonosporopsis vannaccii]|nr:hypothetical protein SVAN01_01959 [Stagonosporopsis vannaccii]